MASFTDIIPKFNPYISQLPVEAMVQVGMEKQRRYDEGIQKIQSQIDNVAGLEILRPVDKAYLQSKLNELGNNLKGLAAGDFSNFQLVNSVSGMTKQLMNDKIVVAATQSAAHDKKQFAYMEEERKKGTLSPANEDNYLKRRQKYLNSGLTDPSGNPYTFSYSYRDFFDVNKFTKETFDSIKPGGWTFDQVYETDSLGRLRTDEKGRPIYSPVMKRVIKEGRLPEVVKQTISQIFSDPRVSQQLSIDGEYNYRNYSSSALAEKIKVQKEELLGGYNEMMADLQLQKSMGKDVQSQIDSLDTVIKNTNQSYNEYINLATVDPDAVRASLYKDDVSSRFTTMFGQMSVKEEIHDNPGWKANFELMKEANEQSRFAQRLSFDMTKEQNDMTKFWADYEQKERLSRQKGRGTPGSPGVPGVGGPTPTLGNMPAGEDAENIFENQYANLGQQFSNAANELIWEGFLSKNPSNQTLFQKLMTAGNTREQAISKLIDGVAASTGEDPNVVRTRFAQKAMVTWNNLTLKEKEKLPAFRNMIDQYEITQRNFRTIDKFRQKIDDDLDALSGGTVTRQTALKDVKDVNISLGGKVYNLKKDDIYDLAIAGNIAMNATLRGGSANMTKMNDAIRRLNLKGLGPVFEAMAGGGKSIDNLVNYASLSPLLPEVKKVLNVVNSGDFQRGSKFRQERIQKYFGASPVLNIPLLTGNAEDDRGMIQELRALSGGYREGQTVNMSPDFKSFASAITGKPESFSIQAKSVMGPDGQPVVEVVLYDGKSNRVGGMTVQRDEAMNRLGLDVDSLYVSPEVSALEHFISINGGRTSAGDPGEKSTYLENDVYFDKNSFPQLANTNLTVKANIVKMGGMYVPYVYASDGVRETKVPRQLTGHENLNSLIAGLKQQLSPQLIQALLIGN